MVNPKEKQRTVADISVTCSSQIKHQELFSVVFKLDYIENFTKLSLMSTMNPSLKQIAFQLLAHYHCQCIISYPHTADLIYNLFTDKTH